MTRSKRMVIWLKPQVILLESYTIRIVYGSLGQKLAITALHESGHPEFRGQPENKNALNKKVTVDNTGHVEGTVMAEHPRNTKQGECMTKKLDKMHGKNQPPISLNPKRADRRVYGYGLLVTVLVCIAMSCSGEKRGTDAFATMQIHALRKLVLDNYMKNDSKYFDNRQNCLFSKYVNYEMDSSDFRNFFSLNELAIFNLECPYSRLRFTLVRGAKGAMYYIGRTDENVLREKSSKNTNVDSLYMSDLSASNEVKVLNDILKNEPIFKLSRSEADDINYQSGMVDLAISLIYETYNTRLPIGSHIFKSIYSERIIDEEEILTALRGFRTNKSVGALGLDSNAVSISKRINSFWDLENKSYSYVFFHEERSGLMIFTIDCSSGEHMSITKEFVPNLLMRYKFTIPDIGGGNEYKECFE